MIDLVPAYDEDGHLTYFDADVHAALAEVGLMRQVAGKWHYKSAAVDMGKLPELAICDFCHERPVTWDVDVTSFASKMTNFHSEGGWMACEPCGAAIAANDMKTLQRRVLAFARSAVEGTFKKAAILDILAGFWMHYKSIKRFYTPYR